MTLLDKISVLQDKHFSEWLKMRQTVAHEISDSQTMFCVCGRLASGLHESSCSKLALKINKETVKRLSHLI